MIAALASQIKPSNISVDHFTAKSKNYFARMGLFRYLGVDLGNSVIEHEPAGRFVPITQIKDSASLTKFVTDIIPLLHLSPREAESIRYIMSELIRNVLEHSDSRGGAYVAAQYYPKSNAIKIGVADSGIGIKKSISRSYSTTSDLDAIRLSLIPGITGTTPKEGGTPQNAGAGLFFIKSIAHVNHSLFMLYSGSGMYKLLKNTRNSLPVDPFQDKHSKHTNLPYWQGTVVGVDISLDNTPEFTSLLDLIRQTYREAIRQRRKARYHKPKFI